MSTLKSDISSHDTSLQSLKTAESTLKTSASDIRSEFIATLTCSTCNALKTQIESGLVYQRDYSSVSHLLALDYL